MKFLEAKRIVAGFDGDKVLHFLFATSGQPEPLELFLEAAAAEQGFRSEVRTLPFNTLSQTIHGRPREEETEVFVLFPWDLLPEADWRSGVPAQTAPFEKLCSAAREVVERAAGRPKASVLYIDAPLPPLSHNLHLTHALRDRLRAEAVSVGAEVLGPEVVSLDNFLAHGSAFASPHLGTVARAVVGLALSTVPTPAKVLVTDFDNTLWRGVVGEDGPDALEMGGHGLGFPHFIYQTHLKALKGHGVILAGVTKNDPDLAKAPLASSESVLGVDDFVAIVASYHPKSAQIAELADQLNLGLDSFVFVDDNPVEIAEVSEALPEVLTVRFPPTVGELPALVETLTRAFHRTELSSEDRDRTDLYQRRLEGMAPRDVDGADLTAFLSSLEMRLVTHDRSTGDRTRAVQLINKTNQFNLNGIRRSNDEVERILAEGGRLFTASLADRHGAHGEILACLVDSTATLRSLVMSCRVFQRRVEHAFLVWLGGLGPNEVRLEYRETERNEPVRHFLRDPAFRVLDDSTWALNFPAFVDCHRPTMDIFDLEGSEQVTPFG